MRVPDLPVALGPPHELGHAHGPGSLALDLGGKHAQRVLRDDLDVAIVLVLDNSVTSLVVARRVGDIQPQPYEIENSGSRSSATMRRISSSDSPAAWACANADSARPR